jgi:methionyl-tRNA synthetase
MKEKKSFYITTTLPYVNAEPHIGFALEILQADVLARYKRIELGKENVFFSTGSDEHGQKIFEAALKAGQDVQEYVDHYAGSFEDLKQALDLSYDNFIRTTDKHHIEAAQKMWKLCKAKGDIYEKEFEGLYCVGCERYLTERDMIDGKCAIHGTEPVLMKEKNWFFNFKKYAGDLLKYLEDKEVIIPDWRREEAINFVKDGLEDFSISREKSRLSWGVPVPDDDSQVMYVWFDALVNYISTLGWPEETGNFEKFWNEGHTVQMAGKDQVRFQSLMWQAMLMSSDIKNTDQIFYHGFINSGGQKMSKSIGNVISPFDLVKKYGTDATRYLLLRHVHSTEDTDVTWEKLDEWYEAGLANGLGNLTSRILKLTETYRINAEFRDDKELMINENNLVTQAISHFDFKSALDILWVRITNADKRIQDTQPFKLLKSENPTEIDNGISIMIGLIHDLHSIGVVLAPFMPETSNKILAAVNSNHLESSLFPRKD